MSVSLFINEKKPLGKIAESRIPLGR